MTSSPKSAGSVLKSAICRNDIFPAGRLVVVRIPHYETFLTENRAAVQLRYTIVASVPPQAGNGVLAGMKRIFPLRSPGQLFSGTRDIRRILNFCRRFAGMSFGSLQACKQSASCFTQCLKLFWSALLHERKQTTGVRVSCAENFSLRSVK